MPDLHKSLLHELYDSSNKEGGELNVLLSIAYLGFINDVINYYNVLQDGSEKSKVLTASIIAGTLEINVLSSIPSLDYQYYWSEKFQKNDETYLYSSMRFKELLEKSKGMIFTFIDTVLEHKDILFKYQGPYMIAFATSSIMSDNSLYIDLPHKLLDDVGGDFYNAYNNLNLYILYYFRLFIMKYFLLIIFLIYYPIMEQ